MNLEADFQSLEGVRRNFCCDQMKSPTRMALTPIDRTGQLALALTTLPGDIGIAGAGQMLRADVYHCHEGTADPVILAGCEIECDHRILFPDQFMEPVGESYNVFDFHNTGESASASAAINFVNWNGDKTKLGQLQVQRMTGNPKAPTESSRVIGKIKRNTWYDFRWELGLSSGCDGYARVLLNGDVIMDQRGPTLFANQAVYLKLANYHALNAGQIATPSTVVHDRVRLRTRA